ncbi:MAG: leucine-rich repeat domain-containing protein, partial [Clostridia bacterium]|nr:leucine-rich repeat domain-containing protein [Clostridia bacterium]
MRKFILNIKRNFVLGMAVVLTALCLSVCLVACDTKTQNQDHGEHIFGDWETVTAATCSAEGTKAKTCSECGYKETEKIPMIDHSFGDWYDVESATCTVAGTKARKCGVCQHEETDVLPIIAHSFNDWKTITPASCTTDGKRSRACKNCTYSETESIEKTGHSFDDDDVCTSCGEIDGFLFIVNADTDTCTIELYSGTKSALRLPSRYHGKAVTHIGERAFADNATLTTVIIPDGIISIGRQAFHNCENLSTLTIADSVTDIGGMAFDRCFKLETVSLSTFAVKYISTSVLKSVNITSGADIESSAFSGCTLLTSVTLHENLASIGERAFDGCVSLENLTIPDSVTKIGYGAFAETSWYDK